MISPTGSGYPAILARWELEFRRARTDLPAAGSPERTLSRTVVEDADGEIWLLERVPTPWRQGKVRIAALLDHLRGAGLAEIAPYRRGPEGDHLIFHRQGWWQVGPYVEGVPLARPAYLGDRWRGEALAEFIRKLATAAESIPVELAGPRFSLRDFIANFLEQVRGNNPELWPRIRPVWEILETSGIFETGFPGAFGHGDFHPVNVIWGKGRIRAVIDWEFTGIKPPLYDAANLLGCLGMEQPEGLAGEMAMGFLDGLRDAGILPRETARTLPERVLAVRFAWLAEWLRKGDAEMVALEMIYLELLARNLDLLREEWGVSM
jgi:homoserine kinase type II